MKDEYIIINKTAIQKRIEQLEEQRKYYLTQKGDYGFHNLNSVNAQLELLKAILSQSTPLVPEIEKAFDGGTKTNHSIGCNADGVERKCYCTHERYCQYPIFSNIQDYISNLKLDI